jgi:hypothetical protein
MVAFTVMMVAFSAKGRYPEFSLSASAIMHSSRRNLLRNADRFAQTTGQGSAGLFSRAPYTAPNTATGFPPTLAQQAAVATFTASLTGTLWSAIFCVMERLRCSRLYEPATDALIACL